MKKFLRCAATVVLVAWAVIWSAGESYYCVPAWVLGAMCAALWKPATEGRVRNAALAVSALFSLFMLLDGLARQSLAGGQVLGSLPGALAGLCGWFLLFYTGISRLYSALAGGGRILASDRQRKGGLGVFLGAFSVLLAVYALYFLIFFPGVVTADSNWQLEQALGLAPLSNHHPLIHTLLIRGLLKTGGAIFGAGNPALGFALAVQLILLALLFALTLRRLWLLGAGRAVVAGGILFYAAVPCNIVYSFTLWKDVWFAGFALLTVLEIFRFTVDPPASRAALTGRGALLFAASLGFCLFRSNGFWALLAAAIIIAVCSLVRRRGLLVPAILALALAAAALIQGPVYGALKAQKVDTVEYLSVPLQQIGRVLSEVGVISQQQYDFLSNIMPVEKVGELYYPRISDNLKNLIRQSGDQQYLSEHLGEFVKCWLEIGLRYPKQYLLAWGDLTRGFWNPDTAYRSFAKGIVDNEMGFSASPVLGGPAARLLTGYLDAYSYIPGLSLAHSAGLAVWLLLLSAGLCAARGQSVLQLLPLIMVWLTLLATTPACGELRYAYSLVACLPFILVCPFFSGGAKEGEKLK